MWRINGENNNVQWRRNGQLINQCINNGINNVSVISIVMAAYYHRGNRRRNKWRSGGNANVGVMWQ
jgi:hypothetical protein